MLRRRRRRARVLAQTPAYARCRPRLTVIGVVAGDRSSEGAEALASVAASRYRQFELLVVEDGSSDGANQLMRGFLEEHPALAVSLLQQPVERGLARSRNTLVEQARGEYVFVLDTVGGIYPSTLDRLVRALDADPRATFSYPMVAAYEGDSAVQLLSSLPWEPERLSREDPIDGTALIRRGRLLELGGYSPDPRLAGLEDFYLWCRCAAAGAHGVHVPQVLAWRRRPKHPETAEAREVMREIFPELLAVPDMPVPAARSVYDLMNESDESAKPSARSSAPKAGSCPSGLDQVRSASNETT